jgi:hypothetical protein
MRQLRLSCCRAGFRCTVFWRVLPKASHCGSRQWEPSIPSPRPGGSHCPPTKCSDVLTGRVGPCRSVFFCISDSSRNRTFRSDAKSSVGAHRCKASGSRLHRGSSIDGNCCRAMDGSFCPGKESTLLFPERGSRQAPRGWMSRAPAGNHGHGSSNCRRTHGTMPPN